MKEKVKGFFKKPLDKPSTLCYTIITERTGDEDGK